MKIFFSTRNASAGVASQPYKWRKFACHGFFIFSYKFNQALGFQELSTKNFL